MLHSDPLPSPLVQIELHRFADLLHQVPHLQQAAQQPREALLEDIPRFSRQAS